MQAIAVLRVSLMALKRLSAVRTTCFDIRFFGMFDFAGVFGCFSDSASPTLLLMG
jgi:hypothetical protein